MNRFDLEKKIALITGGAGLLGVQHALALTEVSATVYITDIDAKKLIIAKDKIILERPDAKIYCLEMDVTNKQSIEAALAFILNESLKIDILINNAAIDPKVKPGGQIEESRFENYSLNSWNFQLNVGITGAFLCSQVFGSWMATNEGGVILNIASDLGVIAPDQRIYKKKGTPKEKQPVKPVTYSVIKSGIIGLTKYLATYWAEDNIRVNALSPGGAYAGQPDEFVGKLSHLIPMGRMASFDEYRGSVQYLCSSASSYVTGHNLLAEGGRTVW